MARTEEPVNATLREQMLARAEVVVNGLSRWVQDHPEADLDAREAVVLERGRALLREVLRWSLVRPGRAVQPARTAGCARSAQCGGSGRARSRRAWGHPRAAPAAELRWLRQDVATPGRGARAEAAAVTFRIVA
jgi:hypothetical protein